MTGLISKHNHFTFLAGELPAKLADNLHSGQTGYWRYQFDRLAKQQPSFYWYCAVANGKILYSGSNLWSATTLLRVLQRYNINIRKEAFQMHLNFLKDLVVRQAISPIELVNRLLKAEIITHEQLQQSLYSKILSDFDQYSAFSSGQATFVPDQNLAHLVPTHGFDVANVLAQAEARNAQWVKIKSYIPSLDLVPKLKTSSASEFSAGQRAKVTSLLQGGNNINKIATNLAKDNIEVALMFAKLVQAGIVTFVEEDEDVVTTATTVLVIDDSSLMLTQFQHWLQPSKYRLLTCQDATKAIAMIQQYRPDTIFIDINMPEISGFDLVKEIRSTPEIANIPIAILTGEQKLSNRWRAKWSSCEFLTKPLTASEQNDFAGTLQELISRLMASSVPPTQV